MHAAFGLEPEPKGRPPGKEVLGRLGKIGDIFAFSWLPPTFELAEGRLQEDMVKLDQLKNDNKFDVLKIKGEELMPN